MHIFIAIPAMDRKVYCDTVRSLWLEQTVAGELGIQMNVGFLPGSSLVTQARNQLVKQFFDTGADKMVFVDADVSWEPGALIKVASHKVDFVGGAYRYKDLKEGYPVAWIEDRDELWADPKTGLLEVEMIPGGFMALTRNVFIELEKKFPERKYDFHGHIFQSFFHCPPNGDGEDGAFCKDWRDIGGKVWLDPELSLTHHDGGMAYSGHIGKWLRNR